MKASSGYIQPIIEQGIADGSIKAEYPAELDRLQELTSIYQKSGHRGCKISVLPVSSGKGISQLYKVEKCRERTGHDLERK